MNQNINNINKNSEKITIEEFIKEVWDVDHIKIKFNSDINIKTILIDHYPFTEPMDGDFTVDDFMSIRIKLCLSSIVSPSDNSGTLLFFILN